MKYNVITPVRKSLGLYPENVPGALLMAAVDNVKDEDISITMCEELADDCYMRIAGALMEKRDD